MIPNWTTIPMLEEFNFDELAKRRVELKVQKDAIEAELTEINDSLATALSCAGEKSVEWQGKRITVYEGRGASQISELLLVEKGVDPDVVAACKVPGKAYTAIKVEEIKHK